MNYSPVQRLEFRPSRNGQIQRFCSEETLLFEEIIVVLVKQIAHKLSGKAIQIRHDRDVETPAAVGRSVDVLRIDQWFVVVEPLKCKIINNRERH